MTDCIFCRIIANQVPSFKLLETPHILAFLDINPLSHGHLLIVPKSHSRKLTDCKDEELQEMMPAAKRLAKALGCAEYNLLQNNGRMAHQEVEHVHLHLIPKTSVKDGLKIQWESFKADMEKCRGLAADIQSRLE